MKQTIHNVRRTGTLCTYKKHSADINSECDALIKSCRYKYHECMGGADLRLINKMNGGV